MALAFVPISPAALSETLPEADREEFRARFQPQWEWIIATARATPPKPGSSEETDLLVALLRIGIETALFLDAKWLDAVRRGAGDHLHSIFTSADDRDIEAERRFALRQLEYAVNVFAETQELAALEMKGYSLADVVACLSGEPADLLTDQENLLACRWQLDLVVALETTDAELEEFKFWTARAVVGARQVKAIMDRDGVTGFRALRARLRAKRSWDDWESDDIERELGPWPR